MFDIFQYAFMQNALLTGSCVAIVSAIVGYFLILRGLTFAGHALAHIGFAGAAGAVLLGINPLYGLLAFTLSAGLSIGIAGKEVRERDLAVGMVMTLALALGVLFLSLYSGFAEQAYSILFGDLLGIDQTNLLVTAISALLTILLIAALFRPLLFSSVDLEMAEARGVPVRWLALAFLLLVAITVAIAVQVVGVLLLLTLLVGPAATAQYLVRRPLWSIVLAIALGLLYVWFGLFLAVNIANGSWPPSFFIAMLAFGVYLPVRLFSATWQVQRIQEPIEPTINPVDEESIYVGSDLSRPGLPVDEVTGTR